MKPNVVVVVLTVSALLAGCGSMMESNKIEYKSAGKLPPLEVPPDLTQPGRDDRYAVPDVAPKGTATFSAYSEERNDPAVRAAAGGVLPDVDKMHIERDGNQRWLVVSGTPDKIWPKLKEFWQGMGFILDKELPEAGIMETDWAEKRAKIPQGAIRGMLSRALDTLYSTPERDKFRTRLEQGAQPGTTEIYISHRGMYEIYIDEGKEQTRWQPRPADPDLEAEMLRRLMVSFGVEESRAKTMMAAAPPEERAKLLPDGSLQVLEPFDRGWRRVGLALDRVGFTVEDRDRSQGVYFVRYVDPEAAAEKEGFFSKLAFWRDSKPDPSKTPKHRILVKADGDNSLVQVLTAEGGVDVSETGKKILRLLHEQLK